MKKHEILVILSEISDLRALDKVSQCPHAGRAGAAALLSCPLLRLPPGFLNPAVRGVLVIGYTSRQALKRAQRGVFCCVF